MNIIQRDYYNQIQSEEKSLKNSEFPSCYINPNSIDHWIHKKMFDTILPLTKYFPKSKWLTIGDGKFASDAFMLNSMSVEAIASSISNYTLEWAKQQAYISEYKIINAEQINEPPDSYDFVFCKEAYHHFSRPPLAFYEMLKVAKQGLILIEPQENGTKLLDWVKTFVKKNVRGDQNINYEISGNYIYRINVNEIKKMLMSMSLQYLAVYRFNYLYFPFIANMDYKEFSLQNIFLKSGEFILNLFSKIGLLNYGALTLIIFKEKPKMNLERELEEIGFKIYDLGINPYVK